MKLSLLIYLLCAHCYLGLTQNSKEDLVHRLFGNTETARVCGINQECVPKINCLNSTYNYADQSITDISAPPSSEKICSGHLFKCCDIKDKIPTPVSNEISSKCGIRNSKDVGIQIGEGDVETQFGEFQWMVAIMREDNKTVSHFICGGSLIAKDVVLTASYCVIYRDLSKLLVRAGKWHSETRSEIISEEDRRIVEIILHEETVALVIVNRPFEYQAPIHPICLADHNQSFDSKRCYTSGWEKIPLEYGYKYPTKLKKIDLSIVPLQDCETTKGESTLGIDSRFVCARREEGKSPCEADAGFPLVCPIDEEANQYVQVGIVSTAFGCGRKNVPGLFANVAYYRALINYQLRSRNIDISENVH